MSRGPRGRLEYCGIKVTEALSCLMPQSIFLVMRGCAGKRIYVLAALDSSVKSTPYICEGGCENMSWEIGMSGILLPPTQFPSFLPSLHFAIGGTESRDLHKLSTTELSSCP